MKLSYGLKVCPNLMTMMRLIGVARKVGPTSKLKIAGGTYFSMHAFNLKNLEEYCRSQLLICIFLAHLNTTSSFT